MKIYVKIKFMDKIYTIARNLRKNRTKEEAILWKLLRNRQFFGLKFKRQFPIGNYVVDFVCEEKKLVIEIDGGQHNVPENIKEDKIRTNFIESKGYKVLRFWNNDINLNIQGVYETSLNAVND